jgi:dihydrofolate reductase
MTVTLVAAIARNGVIGRDNRLLWHLKTDLRRFRALTLGKPLVVGRRTYDSIGGPLPGRRMIVLSRDPGFAPDAAVAVARSWAEAREKGLADGPELMVGGGAEIYALALPEADRLCLTEVAVEPEGDAVFPAFDRSQFRRVREEAVAAGPDDEHSSTFVEWQRRSP